MNRIVEYKWPDGSWNKKAYKRKESATGLLLFIKRLRYLIKLYKLVEVNINYIGKSPVAISTNLKLAKLPEWQRKNENRRLSSKK